MGYIVSGSDTLIVEGFRTSKEIVHPFKFSKKEKSYAAKSEVTGGDTINCGVIGMEVYNEKVVAPTYISRPNITWSTNINNQLNQDVRLKNMMLFAPQTETMCGPMDLSCCVTSNISNIEKQRGFDMGTVFNKEEAHSPVKEVSFDIGTILGTFSIFYASRNSLIDMGVPVLKETQIAFPNPFPMRFCKSPEE